MLVITREQNSVTRITVPPSAETTVIELVVVRSDGKVRLGVEAPKHVQVLRDDAGRTQPRVR